MSKGFAKENIWDDMSPTCFISKGCQNRGFKIRAKNTCKIPMLKYR